MLDATGKEIKKGIMVYVPFIVLEDNGSSVLLKTAAPGVNIQVRLPGNTMTSLEPPSQETRGEKIENVTSSTT